MKVTIRREYKFNLGNYEHVVIEAGIEYGSEVPLADAHAALDGLTRAEVARVKLATSFDEDNTAVYSIAESMEETA